MKALKLCILFLYFTTAAFSQNRTVEDYTVYYYGFQDQMDKNVDSAIYHMQRLAKVSPNSAGELLHNSFAQSFLTRSKNERLTDPQFLAMIKSRNITLDSVLKQMREQSKKVQMILAKLRNDTSSQIRNNIFPIATWVEALENANNTEKLSETGNNYLKYLSLSNDHYTHRKAKYGLLISTIMANNPTLKPTADKLSTMIYNNLRDNQVMESLVDMSRAMKEKRTWYRYLFAYANFITAQNTIAKDKKLAFLKLAFQYSPDNLDKTVRSAYFYDMFFFLEKEKHTFEDDYLSALSNDKDKFQAIMAMSMNDPSFKMRAKELYVGSEDFKVYWLNEFNNEFKTASVFSLIQTDGVRYTLGNAKNKWTLIDFWGTWCAPCREEHPVLEKLYQRTKNGMMPNLNIITIASRDSAPSVNEYMKKLKYSFPVIMSDNKIEASYNVNSWPSKFLISPQGKSVIIPYGVNWEKYIEDYIN